MRPARHAADAQVPAMLLYCGVGVYVSLVFTALWRYLSSPARRPALMRVPPDSPQVRALGAQYRFGPAAYAANLLLAFWKPPVAMALCLAEAVIFLLPPRAPCGR